MNAHGRAFDTAPSWKVQGAARLKELRPVALRGMMSRWRQAQTAGPALSFDAGHPFSAIINEKFLQWEGNEPMMAQRYETLRIIARTLDVPPPRR